MSSEGQCGAHSASACSGAGRDPDAVGFIGAAPATIHVVRRSGEHAFIDHAGAMEHARFLADGQLVTAGHVDKRVVVRSESGAPSCVLSGLAGEVWAFGASPDGTVAAATDASISVWHACAK